MATFRVFGFGGRFLGRLCVGVDRWSKLREAVMIVREIAREEHVGWICCCGGWAYGME